MPAVSVFWSSFISYFDVSGDLPEEESRRGLQSPGLWLQRLLPALSVRTLTALVPQDISVSLITGEHYDTTGDWDVAVLCALLENQHSHLFYL